MENPHIESSEFTLRFVFVREIRMLALSMLISHLAMAATARRTVTIIYYLSTRNSIAQ